MKKDRGLKGECREKTFGCRCKVVIIPMADERGLNTMTEDMTNSNVLRTVTIFLIDFRG